MSDLLVTEYEWECLSRQKTAAKNFGVPTFKFLNWCLGNQSQAFPKLLQVLLCNAPLALTLPLPVESHPWATYLHPGEGSTPAGEVFPACVAHFHHSLDTTVSH